MSDRDWGDFSPSERDAAARGHLIAGLCSDPEHRQMYLNSAEFHSRIDLLVRLLPSWVDGIAAEVRPIDAAREAAVQELIAAPWAGFDSLRRDKP